jgi:hypothetical protein
MGATAGRPKRRCAEATLRMRKGAAFTGPCGRPSGLIQAWVWDTVPFSTKVAGLPW